jgi:S-adenosyl methyltransferase
VAVCLIAMYNARGIISKVRTRAEVEELFAGLRLVDPGVALVRRWHPDEQSLAIEDTSVSMWGGIGVKPRRCDVHNGRTCDREPVSAWSRSTGWRLRPDRCFRRSSWQTAVTAG